MAWPVNIQLLCHLRLVFRSRRPLEATKLQQSKTDSLLLIETNVCLDIFFLFSQLNELFYLHFRETFCVVLKSEMMNRIVTLSHVSQYVYYNDSINTCMRRCSVRHNYIISMSFFLQNYLTYCGLVYAST